MTGHLKDRATLWKLTASHGRDKTLPTSSAETPPQSHRFWKPSDASTTTLTQGLYPEWNNAKLSLPFSISETMNDHPQGLPMGCSQQRTINLS